MKNYWERIETKISEVASVGDRLVCRSVVKKPGSTCELCGYAPISWVFNLWNPKNDAELNVGRECVVNYKKVFVRVQKKNLRLIFPKKLSGYAHMFNASQPGIAEVLNIPDIDINELDQPKESSPFEDYDDDFDHSCERELIADRAPEGMGDEEIDWESLDYE